MNEVLHDLILAHSGSSNMNLDKWRHDREVRKQIVDDIADSHLRTKRIFENRTMTKQHYRKLSHSVRHFFWEIKARNDNSFFYGHAS